MTSTIRVDNFGPSAGGTTYSARGIAKAWVNFNGTGTIAARDSENVSSLTDNGTGDYTVNFNNNFSDANYSMQTAGIVYWTVASGVFAQRSDIARTGSAIRAVAIRFNDALFDANIIEASFYGDLA